MLKKIGLWSIVAAAAVLLSGDRIYGDGEFYVVGGGSPWKRNASSTYFMGNVGIGTNSPNYPLEIISPGPGVRVVAAGGSIYAITGYSTASVGSGIGVYGQTDSHDGSSYGVQGIANSGTAKGVLGCNLDPTGNGHGVFGYVVSPSGVGVYGGNTAAGGTGIFGSSDATTGTGKGVRGVSNSPDSGACGVYGESSATTGAGIGVYGQSNSTNGFGVYGEGKLTGVRGINNTGGGYGVYGEAGHNGFAIYAKGDFGASGTKNAIVPTSQGNRKLYSQESPEVWFEDFGEGKLVEGKAHVDLDALFLETVTIDDKHPMKVFIQLNEDCNGVYVQRQATGFEVKELRAGTSQARFTYRVVAKRKSFETARLEAAPDASKLAALKDAKK